MKAQNVYRDNPQRGTRPDTLRARPGLGMIGFLVIEMIIGYEWLVSGLTKIVNGDFPTGLAGEMTDKVGDVTAWYAGLLRAVVIPNAPAFGYLIEVGEVLLGLALIVVPVVWLFAWDRVPDRVRSLLLFAVTAASVAAIFMALNFHLANGNSHPWFLPKDSFDEGVDFDSLLGILDVVLAAVNGMFLVQLRSDSTRTVAVASSDRLLTQVR